ncbi:hypothetical protein Tco_1383968 [Tanacetum coccineum]
MNMLNVVDIFSLMLIVGNPNGTLAKISVNGSLRLTNNVVLFDVLVVPEYNVSLLSVNKMIKDGKYFIGFNEHKCYTQDLKLAKIIGTSSESSGLNMFSCIDNVDSLNFFDTKSLQSPNNKKWDPSNADDNGNASYDDCIEKVEDEVVTIATIGDNVIFESNNQNNSNGEGTNIRGNKP